MVFIYKICYNELGDIMHSKKLICDILEYIDNNINKEITIEELSNIFYFDKYYIMKLFKKELKITVINYINSITFVICNKNYAVFCLKKVFHSRTDCSEK